MAKKSVKEKECCYLMVMKFHSQVLDWETKVRVCVMDCDHVQASITYKFEVIADEQTPKQAEATLQLDATQVIRTLYLNHRRMKELKQY